MNSLRQMTVTNRRMINHYARGAFAALVLGVALGGCGEPGVTPKSPVWQEKMSNLRDWDDAALRLVDSLQSEGFIPGGPDVEGHKPFPAPYYINVIPQGSAFLDETKEWVEKELLNRDFTIARSAAGATVINLDVNVVHWGSSVFGDGATLSFGQPTRTELVWRASIIQGNRKVVKSSEIIYVSAEDLPLYIGHGAQPPLTTPGVSMLGSAMPIHYAR
jgi:hypothetical protein